MRYFRDAISLGQPPACRPEGEEDKQQSPFRSPRRRGATAMEYLFVISLILCAAITGIGYFGQSTKASMQKSSDAVEKATTGK